MLAVSDRDPLSEFRVLVLAAPIVSVGELNVARTVLDPCIP